MLSLSRLVIIKYIKWFLLLNITRIHGPFWRYPCSFVYLDHVSSSLGALALEPERDPCHSWQFSCAWGAFLHSSTLFTYVHLLQEHTGKKKKKKKKKFHTYKLTTMTTTIKTLCEHPAFIVIFTGLFGVVGGILLSNGIWLTQLRVYTALPVLIIGILFIILYIIYAIVVILVRKSKEPMEI